MKKGQNLKTIKSSNRSAVLYLLNEHGSLSRKTIASMLGLTAAAVTKITANLVEEGAIYEKESVGTGVGRKEILLSLSFGNDVAFGVNFERDYITFSISSLDGNLIESKSIPFNDDFPTVKKEIGAYYESVKTKYSILGAGICIIGRDNKYGIYPNIDISSQMNELFDVPVIIKNNVVAFSTANLIYSHVNEKNVLLFKWGPGIGSSFLREGKVLSGDDHGTTEIGHVIVNPHGKKCRCGRIGCLETESALDMIKEEVSALYPSSGIDDILESDDKRVISILDKKMEDVCLVLLNSATLLNANKIILCGSLFSKKRLVEMFNEKWGEISRGIDNKTIVLSSLNDKSAFIGCTALVTRKLFFEKIS